MADNSHLTDAQLDTLISKAESTRELAYRWAERDVQRRDERTVSDLLQERHSRRSNARTD